MKNKNPLYVVKGKDVFEASSLLDMAIKKLNLEPALKILKNLILFLFEIIENYAMFQVVKSFIDEYINKLNEFAFKVGLKAV